MVVSSDLQCTDHALSLDRKQLETLAAIHATTGYPVRARLSMAGLTVHAEVEDYLGGHHIVKSAFASSLFDIAACS